MMLEPYFSPFACCGCRTDLPMSFEDRAAAVGIATQFQERSKEVFKMVEEETDLAKTQLIATQVLYHEVWMLIINTYIMSCFFCCTLFILITKGAFDGGCKISGGGRNGHRAELYAARVAKCLAGVEGREKVTVDDLKKAIKREKDIQKTRKVFVEKTDMRAKSMAGKAGALCNFGIITRFYGFTPFVVCRSICAFSLTGIDIVSAFLALKIEVNDVSKEMDLELIKQYSQAREASVGVQGAVVDFQRRRSKGLYYELITLRLAWINDTNVILAHEMGLGKTLQSVSMLGFLKNSRQIPGPFLIVVPLSTLSNWAKEFRKWLPDMNVIVYVGIRARREICQQYEFFTEKKSVKTTKFNAPDHIRNSFERQGYPLHYKEFFTENKLLITGTPLQNDVEDLCNFCIFPPLFLHDWLTVILLRRFHYKFLDTIIDLIFHDAYP
uniref:magnesium chelatase n=1 Tax=Kalanchoe fedtschenkoi TaxID=63787 RepID=A0A7N0U345_KALFE